MELSVKLFFNDGNIVEEHVVAWKNKSYFSYIAVSGLPLRVYHATILMKPLKKKSVKVTWQSYLNSKKMTKKDFSEFVTFLEKFYEESLREPKIKVGIVVCLYGCYKQKIIRISK